MIPKEITLVILVVMGFLILLWLSAGIINFYRFRINLLWFKDKDTYYEKNGENQQAEHFNLKEDLTHQYSTNYQEILEFNIDDKYFQRSLSEPYA